MLYDATGRVLCEEVLMDENKIVVVHEHRGCLSMMMRGCGWLILISVVLTMLPLLGSIAAGVGLWFLSRRVWRQLVVESPDSKVVQFGLTFAPIMRSVMAGFACAVLAFGLYGAWSSFEAAYLEAHNDESTEQTSQTQADPAGTAEATEEAEDVATLTVTREHVTIANDIVTVEVTIRNDSSFAVAHRSSFACPFQDAEGNGPELGGDDIVVAQTLDEDLLPGHEVTLVFRQEESEDFQVDSFEVQAVDAVAYSEQSDEIPVELSGALTRAQSKGAVRRARQA